MSTHNCKEYDNTRRCHWILIYKHNKFNKDIEKRERFYWCFI